MELAAVHDRRTFSPDIPIPKCTPTGTAPAAGSPTTVNGRKEIILAAGIIQHDRSRGHVDLIIT